MREKRTPEAIWNCTEAEIFADFPDLTSEDIRACLALAADRERRLSSTPA